MKRIILSLAVFLFAAAAWGQVNNNPSGPALPGVTSNGANGLALKGGIESCTTQPLSADCLPFTGTLGTPIQQVSGFNTYWGSNYTFTGQPIGNTDCGSMWVSQTDNGNLLYTCSRSYTAAHIGVQEINPITGEVVFSWNDPAWAAYFSNLYGHGNVYNGPESIHKPPTWGGNYLIFDVDAGNTCYEMTPANTKVWSVTGLGDGNGSSAIIGGVETIIVPTWPAEGSVSVLNRTMLVAGSTPVQATIKTFTGFTGPTSPDFRNVGGVNYIAIPDWTAHNIKIINYDTSTVAHTFAVDTVTGCLPNQGGPLDVRWVDDNTLAVAMGSHCTIALMNATTGAIIAESAAFNFGQLQANMGNYGLTYSAELTPDHRHAWVSNYTGQFYFVPLDAIYGATQAFFSNMTMLGAFTPKGGIVAPSVSGGLVMASGGGANDITMNQHSLLLVQEITGDTGGYEFNDTQGYSQLYNAFQFNWSSTGLYSGTKDTGLTRLSAGVLKATNGSSGLGKIAQTGGSTNHAACWKSDGTLGYCSVVVDASGVCGTCN